jgi:hypothetical protein
LGNANYNGWSSKIQAALAKQVRNIIRLVYLGKKWVRVFGTGVAVHPENSGARAMTVFKGWLYFGTERTTGLEIWRSWDGYYPWELCVGPNAKTKAGFGESGNYKATCMIVFDDQLYVGTSKGIWCTKDGIAWTKVSGYPAWEISGIAAFNEFLYVTSSYSIWRGKWNSSWEPVVGEPPAKIGTNFDGKVTDIIALSVFDETLYAGAGREIAGIIGIWRSKDGTTWELFKDAEGSCHIHSMAPFSDNLYVGGYDLIAIHRTDGETSWENVTNGVQIGGKKTGVRCMTPEDGKLYLGVYGAENQKILWTTSDGKTWSQVDTSAVGQKSRCDAITSFKNYLYIATARKFLAYGSEWDKLEIWRYGDYFASDWIEFHKPLLAKIPLLKELLYYETERLPNFQEIEQRELHWNA